jgi:ring-1,2-phenylacetyl-CoA epoxidase subunit PaaC
VPPACREPLRDLLIACADTKLLLGYHYGEWTFGAPTLEAAVAHCSLAQGELGHVRLLHGILKAHCDVDPDELVERRPAAQLASNPYLDEPLTDWASVVAMTVVVDQSVSRVVHAFRASAFPPLRACAAKLLEEERYHLHHGQGWLRTLAADAARRPALAMALGRALSSTLFWFGPPDQPGDGALVAAGLKETSDAALGAALAQDFGDLVAALGLDLRSVGVRWDGWTAARRRPGTGGPSDEVLYHLRGTKNAVFKQA